MCDVLSADKYSIRYRLSCSTGGYATVNTSSTSVTLRNLVPNSQYDVEVAAVNSNGAISDFSTVVQFMTPATAPSKIETSPCITHLYSHHHLAVCCTVNDMQSKQDLLTPWNSQPTTSCLYLHAAYFRMLYSFLTSYLHFIFILSYHFSDFFLLFQHIFT